MLGVVGGDDCAFGRILLSCGLVGLEFCFLRFFFLRRRDGGGVLRAMGGGVCGWRWFGLDLEAEFERVVLALVLRCALLVLLGLTACSGCYFRACGSL